MYRIFIFMRFFFFESIGTRARGSDSVLADFLLSVMVLELNLIAVKLV
jgi:hypothetical protein